MLKYFILLILSYIVRSQNVDNDSLAKAFFIPAIIDDSEYTEVSPTISCYKSNNYQTGFLNVYFADEFHPEVSPFFDPMQQHNISIQFVATPIGKNGSDVVAKIRDGLSKYGLSLDFLWVDITFLCEGQYNNTQFLTDMGKSVRVGIKSSYTGWLQCLHDWNATTLYNPILWWDEANMVIDSFNDFPRFGPWQKTSVISSLTVSNCLVVNHSVTESTDLVYKNNDLKNELSTAPPPTFGSPTDPPNVYGNGVMLTLMDDKTEFGAIARCLARYYDTAFLSIYLSSDIDTASIYVIPALLNASFIIQPVITPDFTGATADAVLNQTLAAIASYGITTDIVWVNALHLKAGLKLTLPFLRNMNDQIKLRNMKMGIMTTSIKWVEYTNNWEELAQNGVILWDMGELRNSGYFTSFGGWSTPYAYSIEDIDSDCDGQDVPAFVQIANYNKAVINNVTRMPTTPYTETTRSPTTYGKGLYLYYESQMYLNDTVGTLNCLRAQGYEAVFIQIFTDFDVATKFINFIQLFYTEGFDVYLTIAPAVLSRTDAKKAMDNITTALLNIGFKANFFFYDTTNYIPNKETMNSAGLSNVLIEAQAQNSSLGIFTTFEVWEMEYNGTTAYSNLILLQRSLQSFDTFRGFGGWTSATAATYSTVDVCIDVYEYDRFHAAYFYTDKLKGYAVQSLNSTSTTQSSPTNSSTTPLNNTTMPMTSTLKPSNGTTMPMTSTLKPSNGTTMPMASTLKPSNGTSKLPTTTLSSSTMSSISTSKTPKGSSSTAPPTKPTPTKTISTSTVETSTKASSILMFSHVLLISIASYIL